MGELVRHRQTKGAGTDMSDLQSPRHTSTLPQPVFHPGGPSGVPPEPGSRRNQMLSEVPLRVVIWFLYVLLAAIDHWPFGDR